MLGATVSLTVICLNRGLYYLLIDPERLTTEEIRKLYDNHDIKFTDRYEKKWKIKFQ